MLVEGLALRGPGSDGGHELGQIQSPALPDHAGVGNETFTVPTVELVAGGLVDRGTSIRVQI